MKRLKPLATLLTDRTHPTGRGGWNPDISTQDSSRWRPVKEPS